VIGVGRMLMCDKATPASVEAGSRTAAGAGAMPSLPSGAPAARPGGEAGPLRSGKPRGNPNLAPRCGAKARTTGCACRAPAMGNGRCRMHGGRSTGPRTPEGLARLAAARTTHGDHDAATRAIYRYRRTLMVRSRLLAVAYQVKAYLPSDIAARVALGGNELAAPPRPDEPPVATPGTTGARGHAPGTSGRGQAPAGQVPRSLERGKAGRDARGRFVARARPALRGRMAEREAARMEAAMLAPWRAGIASARVARRVARRAALAAERAARRAARGQHTVPSLPPGACPGGGTERADGADAGVGSVLGQGARCAELGQKPIQRGTERADGADAGVGSVLGQGARCAELGQKPIQRGTERADGADAGVGSALGQGARCAELGQKPIQRGTVMHPIGPGGAEGAGGDKNPMQQDAVGLGVSKEVVDGRPAPAMTFPGTERADGADAGAGSVLGQGAPCAELGQKPILSLPPGTGPGGGVGGGPEAAAASPSPSALRASTSPASAGEVKKGKFRLALLGSTVCNTPEAHKLAAQVARGGGWTVQMAIAAALQAGRDWRPGAAEARQRMAEAANRLRGEALVPPWHEPLPLALVRFAAQALKGRRKDMESATLRASTSSASAGEVKAPLMRP
jgi:hypothetical protein